MAGATIVKSSAPMNTPINNDAKSRGLSPKCFIGLQIPPSHIEDNLRRPGSVRSLDAQPMVGHRLDFRVDHVAVPIDRLTERHSGKTAIIDPANLKPAKQEALHQMDVVQLRKPAHEEIVAIGRLHDDLAGLRRHDILQIRYDAEHTDGGTLKKLLEARGSHANSDISRVINFLEPVGRFHELRVLDDQ